MSRRQKIEHKIVEIKKNQQINDINDIIETIYYILKKEEKDGWEYCDMIKTGKNNCVVAIVFKRQIKLHEDMREDIFDEAD